jgi:hypothetical protein
LLPDLDQKYLNMFILRSSGPGDQVRAMVEGVLVWAVCRRTTYSPCGRSVPLNCSGGFIVTETGNADPEEVAWISWDRKGFLDEMHDYNEMSEDRDRVWFKITKDEEERALRDRYWLATSPAKYKLEGRVEERSSGGWKGRVSLALIVNYLGKPCPVTLSRFLG